MSEAQWWYERAGRQMGPVPFTALQQLAAQGELSPAALVWTAGMAGWARADTVGALAWPAPPSLPNATATPPPFAPAPQPTPAPSAPPGAAQWPAPSAGWPAAPGSPAQAVGEVGEVGVAATILLAIVTLGVYGFVRFFQTGKAYERLAGRETKFSLYFWLFVGFLAGGLTIGVATGLPLGLVAIVFQFLTLGEALKARREALARWQLAPGITADSTHWLFMALAVGLSFLLVGVVFGILQAVRWFQDWNAIRAAALRRA